MSEIIYSYIYRLKYYKFKDSAAAFGLLFGNYTVNLYMYDNKSMSPVDAKITIEKVNPTLKLVFFDNVTLKNKDSELTVVKFRLDSSGNFTHSLTDNEILTPYRLEGL